MADVNEKVVDVEYKEETDMNEEFKDVEGVQDENEKKDLPAVKKENKVTKRDVIVFFSGVGVGGLLAVGAGYLYAKFGIGDPGKVAEKVAEVVPDVAVG